MKKKHEKVLEKVYSRRRLEEAWRQVKKNAGAAGIDNMTVKDFEDRRDELLDIIQEKLKYESYRFKPALRVFINKDTPSKKRPLGIPVVMDRIVSQSMHTALAEIYEFEFTESNYGYRKGKSQHRAIGHVQEGVRRGHTWCAVIDLKSFFDKIPHNLLFKLIRRKIRDEKFVTLLARVLKAGVVIDGNFEKTEKGCPQGSPLSPILSNIVLNELDKELESRGHWYSRWADDFVILLKSERAARRVLESVISYLEIELGLPVNKEKSRVAPIQDVSFLSFQILRKKIRVSNKSRKKFKNKIRQLTRRNNPLSMHQVIQKLNTYLRGWVSYFRIQEFKKLFRELDGWIRSRLRSMQLKKWKKPKKFQRIMIKEGFIPQQAHGTWVKMNKWQSVRRKEVRFVLNLIWFRKQGLIFLDDFVRITLDLV